VGRAEQANLDALASYGTITFLHGGDVALFGDGHDAGLVQRLIGAGAESGPYDCYRHPLRTTCERVVRYGARGCFAPSSERVDTRSLACRRSV
jgi:hypothetical protein